MRKKGEGEIINCRKIEELKALKQEEDFWVHYGLEKSQETEEICRKISTVQ